VGRVSNLNLPPRDTGKKEVLISNIQWLETGVRGRSGVRIISKSCREGGTGSRWERGTDSRKAESGLEKKNIGKVKNYG